MKFNEAKLFKEQLKELKRREEREKWWIKQHQERLRKVQSERRIVEGMIKKPKRLAGKNMEL